MGTSKSSVTGTKQIIGNMVAVKQRWKQALGGAAYLVANNVMARSKRLVPVDLGTLKGSGYVSLPHETPQRIIVEMGYGGNISGAYAAVQHEHTEFRHPEGGQALYLSTAVDEATPRMAADIMALAKQAFEKNRISTTGVAPADPNQGEGAVAANAIAKAFKSLGKPIRKSSKRSKGGRK